MGATLEGVFDPTGFSPTMGGGQSLPISDKKGHLVKIVESEMKQNNQNTGTMLQLTMQILEGPHTGVEGNWNLNIGNANVVAVRIAQQELACICVAVGYMQALQNTEVLHNKPFRVVVSQQPKNPEYTQVTNVLRADGSKLTDPPGSGQPGPASPPPAGFPQAQAPQAQPPTGFPVTNTVAPQQPQQAPQQVQQPWQQAPQQAQQPPQQPPQQPSPQQGVPWGAPPAQ